MSLSPPIQQAPTTAIRAEDLSLVLASVRLRRYTHGRTCALAALTRRPFIEVNCGDRNKSGLVEDARRYPPLPRCVMPMDRGWMGFVFERTQRTRGRAEVLRTWGTGIRALRLEPRYVLKSGVAES